MTTTNRGTIYALLTAVGEYSKVESVDLPTYRMDLGLIGTALAESLRVPAEQIRMVGDDGFVTSVSMVRALSEYQALMTGEDTFLFYFSGHGLEKKLLFSDRPVELQSIIDYINAMPSCQCGSVCKPEHSNYQLDGKLSRITSSFGRKSLPVCF